MDVVLSRHAGACYGVKRALDLAFEVAASSKSAQTLGPLIHNPSVVEDLASRGVKVADSVDDISSSVVVIRSHGVTPEVLERIQELDVEVVDATCPHVMRAQQAAFELAQAGKTVVIVGEADHPEVLGLAAWARRGGSDPCVVGGPDDLPEDIHEPLGVVVQTTQPRERLEAVLDAFRERGFDPEVHDTICSSTSKRQAAARELASSVDAMVVVGGKNSSNTTRLFEICQQLCPRAFHVERADELVQSDFEGVEVVGVTAGASTPDTQIATVVDCLRSW